MPAEDTDARMPLRFPARTHRELKYLARAKGVSMNQLVNDAVDIHIEVLKEDSEVMSQVRAIIEDEKATLDSLTSGKPLPKKKTAKKKKRPSHT